MSVGKSKISEKNENSLLLLFTLIFHCANICTFENIKEVLFKHAFNLKDCVL